LFAYLKECDEEYNKASEFIQEERKRKQMEAIVAGFKYKSNLQKRATCRELRRERERGCRCCRRATGLSGAERGEERADLFWSGRVMGRIHCEREGSVDSSAVVGEEIGEKD